MLKKPGDPALSSGFCGVSPRGSVVRIEEGTSSLGPRLKYALSRGWGEAKRVTWRAT